MKKFEEEVKRPVIGIEQSSIKPSLGKAIEFYTGKVKEYHNAFNEMNKYIDGLEAQLDYYKKDKRFEVMAEEILSLKSQLEKQQPEIPEFVAEYIERCKRSDCGLIWAVRPDRDANENSEKIYDWLYPNGVRLSDGTFPEPFEPDNLVRPDKENHIKFVRAWLDGYTIEKPQLFYLKNKIELEEVGSDLIGYLNLFLTNGGYLTNNINRAKKFTKQEIDSMETGSYEQIEVQE